MLSVVVGSIIHILFSAPQVGQEAKPLFLKPHAQGRRALSDEDPWDLLRVSGLLLGASAVPATFPALAGPGLS